MKLYEATDALDRVRQMLEESEGEWTPEIEVEANAAEGNFNEKVERVALFIRDRLANLAALEGEIARLSGRARALERTAASLKEYLTREMQRAGKEEVVGVLATVAFQKNPASVHAPEWDEHALRGMAMYVPQFVTEKPAVFALNKRAILEAHKAGQPIPEGVEIVQTSSLRIR